LFRVGRRGTKRSREHIRIANKPPNLSIAVDARELWRRLVFNLLITNTDDHLQNLGFLYDGSGFWRIAPAFDVNPMPGKLRESKTWLTEDAGPIDSVQMLLDACAYFALSKAEALLVLAEVLDAVLDWKQVALKPDVGLTQEELPDLEDAFEHDQTDQARKLLGRPMLRPDLEEETG
jgi:serine/threonine-protein kinase HipA